MRAFSLKYTRSYLVMHVPRTLLEYQIIRKYLPKKNLII